MRELRYFTFSDKDILENIKIQEEKKEKKEKKEKINKIINNPINLLGNFEKDDLSLIKNYIYKNKINWDSMCLFKTLSSKFIYNYIDDLPLNLLIEKQTLYDFHLIKLYHKINKQNLWNFVIKKQKLTNSFIYNYLFPKKYLLEDLLTHQELNKFLLIKIIEYLNTTDKDTKKYVDLIYLYQKL